MKLSMHCSIYILLGMLLTLQGCWIEAVDDENTNGDNGNEQTEAAFTDVSADNLPLANLGNNSMDAKAADIDGDGDLDLIIAVEFFPNKVLINNGNAVFTDESAQRLPAKDFDSEDIAIADFDNSGSLDLIFVSEDNQTNEYYLNDGDGNFTDVSGRLPVTGTSNAVLTADLNGDGSADVLIGNNGQNVALINNGNGFFSNQTNSRLPQITDITQDLALGNIDTDSDLDLLVANEDENRLFINQGNGFFVNRTQTRLPLRDAVEESREVDLADVDKDGNLDIYFANVILFQDGSSAQDRLLINNQGSFTDVTQAQLPPISTNTLDADFFDANNDGNIDLVTGDFGSLDNETGNYSGNNVASVYINNGTGFFSNQTDRYFPTNFSPAATDFEIADFNGDGRLDMYISNFRSPDVLLLRTN